MTIVPLRLMLALGVTVLLVAGSPRNSAEAARPAVETLERQFPMARPGRLTIQNSRGDITIQTWARPAIELKAVKTADGQADLAAVAVDVRATDDQVAISSRAATGGPLPRLRVDYQLRVPADTDLKLIETARGRVQIAGTTGRAIVRVENGTVRISEFSGTLDAMATNGEIDAALTRVDANESIKLETFNGDIRLRLPKTAAPHFQVRTLNGTVTSELPLNVQNPFGPQVAHEAGAPGAPFVSLITVSGDIRILRR